MGHKDGMVVLHLILLVVVHLIPLVVVHLVPLVVVHLLPLVVVHLIPLVKNPKYPGYFSHFEAIEIFVWYLLCLLLLSSPPLTINRKQNTVKLNTAF